MTLIAADGSASFLDDGASSKLDSADTWRVSPLDRAINQGQGDERSLEVG
jgi:hypothetical protein